ncbi:MAG: YceI family protein [Phycisphaerales bacterium]|nr:YceI family protein [Phycisphaerales bacterium]
MHRNRLLVAVPAALILTTAGILAGLGHTPAAPGAAPSAAPSYQADPVHSSVIFNIRHVGVTSFYGRFNDFSGSFTFDPASAASGAFEFEVKTESVDTHNQKRDDHLRSADFFNARQFPTITFKSTAIKPAGDNTFKLTGDLTLQGETRPVTADLEWLGTGTGPTGGPIGSFEARFEIKRSDFGMSKYLAPDNSDSGGLGNTVKLIVSIEAAKQ